jgi:hypothetical protein
MQRCNYVRIGCGFLVKPPTGPARAVQKERMLITKGRPAYTIRQARAMNSAYQDFPEIVNKNTLIKI